MESLMEKSKKINQQYAPIDNKIRNIPEQTYEVDGVKYPKASWLIKINLMKLMLVCKRMKVIDIDFPAPFSKSELEEFATPPFTKAKVERAKKLWKKYRRIEDEARKKGSGVV